MENSKVLSMKKCKECGKMFMPKSAQQQYCEDMHYRPCPVCGDLVYAKYLSDPARRCKKCIGYRKPAAKNQGNASAIIKKSINASEAARTEKNVEVTSKAEVAVDSKDFTREEMLKGPVVAIYKGLNCLAFVPDHKYIVRLKRCSDGYRVEGIQDLTNQEVVDYSLTLPTMSAVKEYFKRASI